MKEMHQLAPKPAYGTKHRMSGVDDPIGERANGEQIAVAQFGFLNILQIDKRTHRGAEVTHQQAIIFTNNLTMKPADQMAVDADGCMFGAADDHRELIQDNFFFGDVAVDAD